MWEKILGYESRELNKASQQDVSKDKIKQQIGYYLKQPELRKQTTIGSRHSIPNYFWDSENLLKENNDYLRLLHRNSVDILTLIDGHWYELHENWINNLNNILDEVESHFVAFKPSVMKYLKIYLHTLAKSSKQAQELEKFLVPKKLDFLDEDGMWDYQKQYYWFRFPANTNIKNIIIFMKFLFLHLPQQDKNLWDDILGWYLSFLKERLDLHASTLFIRREDIFKQTILSLGNGILKPRELIVNEDYSWNAKKDHDYNSIWIGGNGIDLKINWKKSKLIWRIKSSKSKWDKSQIKTGYKRVENLQDFFWLTNIVENEDQICENFAYFLKKFFELKNINQLKELKISNKLDVDENILYDKILKNLKTYDDSKLIDFFEFIWQNRESSNWKKWTYQDIKFEAAMILEWLSARSEFKLMTQKMYQEAEKWDEANHALRSRVKKFSKINGIISSYEINKYFFRRIYKNWNFVLPHFNKKPMTSFDENDLRSKDFIEKIKAVFDSVLKKELVTAEIFYEWKKKLCYFSNSFIQNLSPKSDFVLVDEIPKNPDEKKIYIKKIDWVSPL